MGVLSWFSHAKKSLFTREDTFNVHKTFGFPCLVHFLYRFSQVGPTDCGFGATRATAMCLFMHVMLSSTSLIFKIPTKRIKEGSRIWPEYRLHSIAFAMRSIACMAVVYVETALALKPMYWINALIVLLTCAAADAGSASVGEAARSSTIRDLEGPAALRFFFSFGQFVATTNCLIGQRRYSLQFVYVWVIQFTAFLLTLRRKNLAPHNPLMITYGAMLAFGIGVALYEAHLMGSTIMPLALSNIAVIGRMYFGINKYVLWAGMAVVVHFARMTLEPGSSIVHLWPFVWGVSTLGVMVIAARYVNKKNKAEEGAAPKQEETPKQEAVIMNGEHKKAE
jgi:hypothetical protein